MGKLRSYQIRRGQLPRLNIVKKDGKMNPIWVSVNNHRNNAFNSGDTPRKRVYRGTPFANEWNKNEGGSTIRAAWEIEADIGPKPGSEFELAVIDYSRGFVRGNLCWDLGSINWLEAAIRRAYRNGASKSLVEEMVRQVYA